MHIAWVVLSFYCVSAWVYPFTAMVAPTQLDSDSILPYGRFAVYSNTDQPGPFNSSISIHLTATSKLHDFVSISLGISTNKVMEKEIADDRLKLVTEMCCETKICRENSMQEVATHAGKIDKNASLDWVSGYFRCI